MDVILLERIERLGQMGDVVSVKDGFARNYLLPQAKALRATKSNLERFEHQRGDLEARNLERRTEAEGVGARMDGVAIVLVRQASDMGQLYGSVSARDIALTLSEEGYKVERAQVVLDRPIKSLGLHPVRLVLHPEVSVSVEVNVARSEEEAVLQAAGEVLDDPNRFGDLEDEDEERPEVFEDREDEPAADAALDGAAGDPSGEPVDESSDEPSDERADEPVDEPREN